MLVCLGRRQINGRRLLTTIGDATLLRRPAEVCIDGVVLQPDHRWNIPNWLHEQALHRRLLHVHDHPLNLLKRRIVQHLHATYRKPASGSPLFTVVENAKRVVTVWENFDSLLTPADHPSRRPSDTYFVNSEHVLRGHTSAHQHELIKQGLDNFVVIGDVFRRDEINRTHYPCFHQMEAVRLFSSDQLFDTPSPKAQWQLFEQGERTAQKQETHSRDCAILLELNLKKTLELLAKQLFGAELEMRWVDAYFPFTHPSFELEVLYNGDWLELLGCGVIEQKLLASAGVMNKAGWAFGLGLERLAMRLYSIPDIRLFWTKESGFLSQFAGRDPNENFSVKALSRHPAAIFDVSFWLPAADQSDMDTANVLDLIRSIGGDIVEQVNCVDNFVHPKTGRRSQCYRINYRSMEKALSKEEVNVLHRRVESALQTELAVTIREN